MFAKIEWDTEVINKYMNKDIGKKLEVNNIDIYSEAGNYSGVSSDVNIRTGKLQVNLVLPGLSSVIGNDFGITAFYLQDNVKLGNKILGLPIGWCYSISFIIDGMLYINGQKKYFIDDNEESGLRYYKLKNLRYENVSLDFPYDKSRKCTGVLKFLEGETQYFDDNGLLLGVDDRFGNHVVFYYKEQEGSVYNNAIVKIVDSYGQQTVFEYSDNSINVNYPKSLKGTHRKIKLQLDESNIYLKNYSDALGDITVFENKGGISRNLISTIEFPNGLKREYVYGVMKSMVSGVEEVLDCVNKVVNSYGEQNREVKYNYKPEGIENNYTGYPLYSSVPGEYNDVLMMSNNNEFRYGCEVDNGLFVTRYKYNYLHLVIEENSYTKSGKMIRQLKNNYCGEDQDGNFPEYYLLPANYQRVKKSTTVIYDDNGNSRKYYFEGDVDDHGNYINTRKYKSSKAGDFVKEGEVQCKYDYHNYGFKIEDIVTDFTQETPKVSCVKNILTEDGKSIASRVAGSINNKIFKGIKESNYKYDSVGRVTRAEFKWCNKSNDPESTSYNFSYLINEGALNITSRNAQGHTLETKIDIATNEVVSKTTQLGRTVSYAYDSMGRVISVELPSGIKTLYSYDIKNNKNTVIYSNGYEVWENRNGFGEVVKITDNMVSEGRVIEQRFYNDLGQLIETKGILGDNSKVKRSYDERGLIKNTEDVLGNTVSYEHDPVDQITKKYYNGILILETDFNDSLLVEEGVMHSTESKDSSIKIESEYNLHGDKKTSESIGDHWRKVTMTYDDEYMMCSKLISSWDKCIAKVDVTRNLFGKVVQSKIEVGSAKKADSDLLVFNNINQLIEEQNALKQKYVYDYDADGLLTNSTTYSGKEFQYKYNEDGRIISTSYKDKDGALCETRVEYYKDTGLVKSIENFKNEKGEGAIEYNYAKDGNLLSIDYGQGRKISCVYDYTKGRIIEMNDISGKSTVYNYDKYGRITNSSFKDGSYGISLEYYTKYESKIESGNIKKIVENNELTKTFKYDGFGSLLRSTLVDSKANVLSDIEYKYDNTTRNVTEVKYQSSVGIDNKKVSYIYNGLDQLVEEIVYSSTGQKISKISYAYDAADNILEERYEDSKGTDVISYTYDADNKLIAVKDKNGVRKLSYDIEGNLLSDGKGNKYIYNEKNQMISHERAGKKTIYEYYPTGLRKSKKIENENAIQFYYLGGNIINEVQGSIVSSYFAFGSERYARFIKDGNKITKQKYLNNFRNDIIAILDGSNHIEMQYDYSPYGMQKNEKNDNKQELIYVNPFQYSGEYTDLESGLIYLRSRYYNPSIKRFTSRDRALQFNRYFYCNANPVMNSDPSGHGIAAGLIMIFSDLSIFGTVFGIIAAVGVITYALTASSNNKIKSHSKKHHNSKIHNHSKSTTQGISVMSKKHGDPSVLDYIKQSYPAVPDHLRFQQVFMMGGQGGGQDDGNQRATAPPQNDQNDEPNSDFFNFGISSQQQQRSRPPLRDPMYTLYPQFYINYSVVREQQLPNDVYVRNRVSRFRIVSSWRTLHENVQNRVQRNFRGTQFSLNDFRIMNFLLQVVNGTTLAVFDLSDIWDQPTRWDSWISNLPANFTGDDMDRIMHDFSRIDFYDIFATLGIKHDADKLFSTFFS